MATLAGVWVACTSSKPEGPATGVPSFPAPGVEQTPMGTSGSVGVTGGGELLPSPPLVPSEEGSVGMTPLGASAGGRSDTNYRADAADADAL